MVYKIDDRKTEEDKKKEEEARKKDCLFYMERALKEIYGDKQKSYQAESKYYLETTNYNLSKALDEFEADMKFEREQMEKNKKYKKKK